MLDYKLRVRLGRVECRFEVVYAAETQVTAPIIKYGNASIVLDEECSLWMHN